MKIEITKRFGGNTFKFLLYFAWEVNNVGTFHLSVRLGYFGIPKINLKYF